MPQDKRPLGLIKSPKLPIKRVKEISDSLENMGYATLGAARKLKEKAKTDIEKRTADYLGKSGINDLRKSERYRSLIKNK